MEARAEGDDEGTLVFVEVAGQRFDFLDDTCLAIGGDQHHQCLAVRLTRLHETNEPGMARDARNLIDRRNGLPWPMRSRKAFWNTPDE